MLVVVLLLLQVADDVFTVQLGAVEFTMSSFPLGADYDYRLFCVDCFQDNKPVKQPSPTHRCCYDLLAVQDKKSKRWFRVRRGRHQKSFKGKWRMCCDWNQKEVCPRGDSCAFAHGTPELLLFTLEKDKKFNIAEFIREARLQCVGTQVKLVIILHSCQHPLSL